MSKIVESKENTAGDITKAEVGFDGLVGLFEQTQTAMQTRAARSVDTALVVRNWLFGWYIAEFEQNGKDRAAYGKRLLKELSSKLSIKGCSERNLASFRKFNLTYPDILQALPAKLLEIGQAVPDSSLSMMNSSDILQAVTERLMNRFVLGWTHYVTLLTVKNDEERRFYEKV